MAIPTPSELKERGTFIQEDNDPAKPPAKSLRFAWFAQSLVLALRGPKKSRRFGAFEGEGPLAGMLEYAFGQSRSIRVDFTIVF